MKRNDPTQILHVIQELLSCTRMLAGSTGNPEADVLSLASLCRDRLRELEEIMPDGLLNSIRADTDAEGASELWGQVLVAFKLLDAETRGCVQQLTLLRDQVGGELSILQQKRRAIKAYQGRI